MITIKLIGTRRKQSDTLYWLITNGKTTCYIDGEIIIDDELYNKLKKQKELQFKVK